VDVSWYFKGGTLGLFLVGFMSRLSTDRAAINGICTGVPVILWMTIPPRWEFLPSAVQSPFPLFLIIVFGPASILAVGLTVTFFTRKKTEEK